MERTLGQMEILEEVDKQEVTAIETNSLLCSEEFRLLVLERDITFQFLVLDIFILRKGHYIFGTLTILFLESLREGHYILVFGS